MTTLHIMDHHHHHRSPRGRVPYACLYETPDPLPVQETFRLRGRRFTLRYGETYSVVYAGQRIPVIVESRIQQVLQGRHAITGENLFVPVQVLPRYDPARRPLPAFLL